MPLEARARCQQHVGTGRHGEGWAGCVRHEGRSRPDWGGSRAAEVAPRPGQLLRVLALRRCHRLGSAALSPGLRLQAVAGPSGLLLLPGQVQLPRQLQPQLHPQGEGSRSPDARPVPLSPSGSTCPALGGPGVPERSPSPSRGSLQMGEMIQIVEESGLNIYNLYAPCDGGVPGSTR